MAILKRVSMLVATAALAITSIAVSDANDALAHNTRQDEPSIRVVAGRFDGSVAELWHYWRTTYPDSTQWGGHSDPDPADTTAASTQDRGTDGCPELIEQELGREGCMISFCESGWDPDATGVANEMGWFQIHPGYHPDATHDPEGNVAAAVRISNGGTDWRAWTVRSVLETGVCPGGAAYPG